MFLTTLQHWESEFRTTAKLALPIMAGFVGQMMLSLADTIMVGRVGTVPLAAAALGHNISHLFLVSALGVSSAVAVLTSHAYGARNHRAAGEVLRHGMVLCFVLSLASAVLLVLGRDHLTLLGQPEEVVIAASPYILLVAWSIMPALLSHVVKQFSEALAHPWKPMLILTGAVFLNIFLNWILIYGNLGAPAMGVTGAGLATLISRALAFAGMLVLLGVDPDLKKWLPTHWLGRLRLAEFRKQFDLGFPVGLQHLVEVGAFAFAGLMTGWLSAEAMAAHQIAITCAATTFIFALGWGMAVSIRVGHAWGAGDLVSVRRVGFSGLATTLVLMTGFALVYLVGRHLIAGAFSPSQEVVALAAAMLLIAAMFQVFDGLQVVAMLSLRGMSDVRVPAVIAIASYWVLSIPVGYLLGFLLGWGALGIWVGLAVGLALAAALLCWRFHRIARPEPRST